MPGFFDPIHATVTGLARNASRESITTSFSDPGCERFTPYVTLKHHLLEDLDFGPPHKSAEPQDTEAVSGMIFSRFSPGMLVAACCTW